MNKSMKGFVLAIWMSFAAAYSGSLAIISNPCAAPDEECRVPAAAVVHPFSS